MFGQDKNLRMKALAKMMSDKPSFPAKKPQMDEGMEMDSEGGPEKSYVAFPVTEEEKQMILDMRKQQAGGMEEEPEEEMA